jgi:hypothetical protein
MSERTKQRLRLLFIGLVVANVLVFTLFKLRPDPNEAAALRIKEVQINAGSVKLLAASTRGAGETVPSAAAGAACLEWGPIAAGDVAAADSALEKLVPATAIIRRSVTDSAGGERFAYFVREPDKTVVGQFAELQSAFPGTQIKAGNCPEDLAAARPK